MKNETKWKLFLDDERFPVDPEFCIARNSYDAIWMVKQLGCPVEIAFDHDLSGNDTVMTFLRWFEDAVIDGVIDLPKNFCYSVHSQNPVGAENIRSRMDQLIKHFGETDEE